MLTKKKNNNNNKDVCTATVGYNSKNNNNNNKNQNNNLNNDNNYYNCLNCSTITIIDNDNKNSKNEIQGMTIGSKYFCIEPMTFEIISKISWKVLSFVFVVVFFFLSMKKWSYFVNLSMAPFGSVNIYTSVIVNLK